MNNPNNHIASTNPRDFWDSLHLDILTANQNITHEDYTSFIERSFLYSLFFRGCHLLELNALRNILKIKDYGYVLTLNLPEHPQSGAIEEEIDELEFFQYLHHQFIDKNICIGPQIINRVILLVTEDSPMSTDEHREKSYSLSNDIIACINDHFQINLTIGIGSPQPINTIYSSFIDAFSALYYRSTEPIIYYQDMIQTDSNVRFDYLLAEKHLIEAIRLRKSEAYDYFSLIMDQIRSYSDETRRNKILEILVLASHALSLDKQDDFTFIDYSDIARELMKTSGALLIETAYKYFILMTSYVKPQSNIDYSNHIVKVTQEYLESHYAEDISLEDVAEQVNISPQYFSKLIKKTTGFNFIDWLSMLRVKKAKELLTNSNLTVKEVCFMVGYKDPNYFSRIFKKRIGITPSEYVKKQLLY
jgi:two-component system response regulator YesN